MSNLSVFFDINELYPLKNPLKKHCKMSLLHLYLTNSRVTNCYTFLAGNSKEQNLYLLDVSLKIVSLNFLKFSRCLLDISTNQPKHFCKTWALFT